MLTLIIMVAGVAAAVLAWRVVSSRRASIWTAMSLAMGGVGIAAVATGEVVFSGRVGVALATTSGLGAGVVLYLATTGFVLVVRRWHVFDRHVEEIYDRREGLPLGVGLLLAAAITAPGEELFWRGLFQARLAESLGWAGAAGLTWASYALVNATSRSLPILAGGVVGGAAWGALALWSHGVLASVLAHAAWTALMLAFPPGGVPDVTEPVEGERRRPRPAAPPDGGRASGAGGRRP